MSQKKFKWGRCKNFARSVLLLLFPIFQFSADCTLYGNNLKNLEFDKETPQNFDLERATIKARQGAGENQNSTATTTLSKTDSSGCLGVSCDSIFQGTRFEFGYDTGNYISIDKDYAEVDVFVPLFLSNCYTLFFDVHGYRFNNGKWAASTGVGIRKNLTEFSALGMNTYYDYRRGKSKRNFHQIGLGFEWLNNCFDFRTNGYLPISKKTQTWNFCVFDQLGDDFFATRRKIEYAYSGFDAEIGKQLFSYFDFNLYSAVGPYYYLRSHQNHFWGGYGRVELDWKSILSVQIKISYDRIYRTNIQGTFQISIPLELFCSGRFSKNCGCHRLPSQQTMRNGIILTDHCCKWKWNWE